jgi:isocitrate dehydrogenase
VYFASVLKNMLLFTELGVDTSNGLGDVYAKLQVTRTSSGRNTINQIENGPALAMVNSDKGITELHVPSDVIVDASMPMIHTSGKMWNKG